MRWQMTISFFDCHCCILLAMAVTMNQYSKTSEQRLNSCHPDIVLIFKTVLELVDHSIFCGFRAKPEQDQAFAEGNSKLQWPNSNHNQFPSLAIDAGPYFKDLRNTDWDDYLAFSLFAGHVLAIAKALYLAGEISHQLIWGGDWNSNGRNADQHFNDLPHFELTKENVWSL